MKLTIIYYNCKITERTLPWSAPHLTGHLDKIPIILIHTVTKAKKQQGRHYKFIKYFENKIKQFFVYFDVTLKTDRVMNGCEICSFEITKLNLYEYLFKNNCAFMMIDVLKKYLFII